MACHTDILTKQVNPWYFWFAIILFAEDIQGVSKKTPVSGKMAITSLWKVLGAKVG